MAQKTALPSLTPTTDSAAHAAQTAPSAPAAPKPVAPEPAPEPANPKKLGWNAARWILLLTVSSVLALDALDVSMVGVALPSIGQTFGLDPASLQWIVSAYVLGYGGLLLLGGRMADLLGRRRIFLIALTVFAAASLLGGLVNDPTVIIATRFIKGVAAAFTAPTAFSIITTNFPEGPHRNKAISIFTMFGASGFSLGLVVGGLMTSLSWRWTFLFSVPFAIAAVLIGLKFIPRDKPDAEGGHDIGGAATLALGMLTLVYTVVSAGNVGWGAPATVIGFIAAAILLAAFTFIELKVKHPLVRFGIFRQGLVARANISIVALFGSYLSFQFLLTLFLQDVLGWTPLSMALALLPAGLVVLVSATFMDKVIDRVGTRIPIGIAMISLVVGYVLFLRIGATPNYALDILPSVILLGLGFALGFPAINVQATSGIKDAEQGLAAGLIQSSAQVGAAIVLAITTALVTSGAAASVGSGSSEAASAAVILDSFRPGLYLSAAVAILGLVIALLPVRKRAATSAA